MDIVLSPYQENILDFISGNRTNLGVRAVAGSGKSFILHRSRYRIQPRSNVAMLAFNDHIVKSLAAKMPARTDCMTIHSLGKRSIGHYLNADLKVEQYKAANLADEVLVSERWISSKNYKLVAETVVSIADKVRLCLVNHRSPGEVFQLISRFGLDSAIQSVASSCGVSIDAMLNHVFEWVLDIIDRSNALVERGVIDFTDMLYVPWAFKLPVPAYDVVMIDEAQDLSPSQMHVALSAARNSGRVIFVGDENQAIQSFAGAMSDSFARITSATKASTLPLSVCYRCPQSHVRLAQEIVPSIQWAPGAPEGVIETLPMSTFAELDLHDGDLVISRTNSPLVRAALKFIRRGIKVTIRGKDLGSGLNRLISEASSQMTRGPFGLAMKDAVSAVIGERVASLEGSPGADDAIELLRDQRDCILAAIDGNIELDTVAELKALIQSLFVADGPAACFSSVHRAKGLEGGRVFILEHWKLGKWREGMTSEEFQQEKNLKYVAYTRSTHALYFVDAN